VAAGCGFGNEKGERRTHVNNPEFFPPQPKLYTVEAHGRPVVVLSATRLGPPPDEMLAYTKVIEALRNSRHVMSELADKAKQRGFNLEEEVDLREIDEALETWLGEDLLVLEDAESGVPLWDGDENTLCVRQATADEAAAWNASLEAAMNSGEHDPGDMDWVCFLVSVIDPTDDDDDEA
jgi:hypothetical protein